MAKPSIIKTGFFCFFLACLIVSRAILLLFVVSFSIGQDIFNKVYWLGLHIPSIPAASLSNLCYSS